MDMTLAQVSEATGINERTLRTWCKKGDLKFARKMGRDWFIPKSKLSQLPKVQGKGKASPNYGTKTRKTE